MKEPFYHFVWAVGSAIFWLNSRPLVMHAQRARRTGPFLLVANHHSPFDVPLMIRHTPRMLDFVSTVEVFSRKFVAWFYGSMNAFPLDRSKRDIGTMRIILDRLARGRVVAMFPEGRVRAGAESVVRGGSMRRGTGRLAQLAGVEVVPCVVVNSAVYFRIGAWLPLRRIRYGVIYGEPIAIHAYADDSAAEAALDQEVKDAMVRLYSELCDAMEAKFKRKYA